MLLRGVAVYVRYGNRPTTRRSVHLHMLFLDGTYVEHQDKPRFRRVSAPFKAELEVLVRQISERVGRHPERKGLLERDLEPSYLTLDRADQNDGMNSLLGHLITYRIAGCGQECFARAA